MSVSACQIHVPTTASTAMPSSLAMPAGLKLFDGQTPVLARIPDLEGMGAAVVPCHGTTGSEGRLFNQRLSNKLIVGGAVLVALAAVLPFLPLRRGDGRLHPAAGPAPQWNSAATAQVPSAVDLHAAASSNPTASSNVASTLASANRAGRTYLQTQPLSDTNRPMALADAAVTSPGKAAYAERTDAYPNSLRAQSESTGEYRNELRVTRRLTPAVDYQNQYPDSRGVQGHPLMPAADDSPQPGVARLEGTIAKPPLRSTYDGVGSSVH